MALGDVTEFETDELTIFGEHLTEFEAIIFEQCNEMAWWHFGLREVAQYFLG